MRGFSFSSVILSYFLVGGGLFAGMLVLGLLKVQGEMPAYAFMIAGAFVGGFIAARASRGSTVIEPAIGAIAVVGTIVGLVASTEVGRMIWHVAQDETMKFVGLVGACSAGGAIVGAYLSEKIHGEATTSAWPWMFYTGFATFGASVLATVIATVLFATSSGSNIDTVAKMLLVGLVIGCLLAGLAVGASARTRPLIAAMFGGGLGIAGFGLLIAGSSSSSDHADKDALAGLIVLVVGGAIVTLIGTAIGWAAVGKRQAG